VWLIPYRLYFSDDYTLCFSMMREGRMAQGTRPDKNCVMLSLKFPRQKIVKGDFLNRDGDFRA
jgi:hypothetical protein